MEAANRHIVNANDLFTTYGVAVSGGTDDFLKFPARKTGFSMDWPEENGTEYDLTAPTFKEKQITLSCWLRANSEADFWIKYDAFLALLKTPGLLNWTVKEFERTFQVFYQDCKVLERMTRIKDGFHAGKVYMKFEIELIQPVP